MKDIHLLTSGEFFKIYLGTEHEDMDCWGLIREFYLRVLGKDLPEYYKNRPRCKDVITKYVTEESSNYYRVDTPQLGDIILIKLFGVPLHVGLYLDEKKFAHSIETHGVVVDEVSRWKNRFEGYYRPK